MSSIDTTHLGDANPFSSSRSASISLTSDPTSLDMKDVSISSTRQTRNSFIYPKKRPSPHGVHKGHSHRSPSLLSSHGCRSPRSAKVILLHQQQQQRLRGTQYYCRKENVLLEEEYRDEIRYYMHDMEVSSFLPQSDFACSVITSLVFSVLPCPRLSLWINNLRSDGTCVPAW